MTIRRSLTALATGTVAAVTIGVAPSASALRVDASAEAPVDSGVAVQARLDRACARIPNLTTRTENVLARIQGDAETRGSLLWLDRRIENATDEGRDQLAEALTNRRAVREASIPLLEQRLLTLAEIAGICADAGSSS